MNSVYIIYNRYLDNKGKNKTIGGVQTYISNLFSLIIKMGLAQIIIQMSEKAFDTVFNNYRVIGIKTTAKKFPQKAIKNVPPNSLVIFASEEFATYYEGKKISIQHGISWDRPKKSKLNCLYPYHRAFVANNLIKKLKGIDAVVCVDCNYINWYRTQLSYPEANLIYIPNFTIIPNKTQLKKDDECISIIFARRFIWFRGTQLFAESIKQILRKYNNIKITIAGEGPDEDLFRNEFREDARVIITRYDSEKSIMMHSDKHIAVIPTLGSEGTSLSLLEAMASKCAVICTNVGGMTNIIIDRFNGLMISPKSEELTKALELLITDCKLRNTLSENAYTTVQAGFSHDLWEEKWKRVISEVINESRKE